jgi:hypothetical protein
LTPEAHRWFCFLTKKGNTNKIDFRTSKSTCYPAGTVTTLPSKEISYTSKKPIDTLVLMPERKGRSEEVRENIAVICHCLFVNSVHLKPHYLSSHNKCIDINNLHGFVAFSDTLYYD